MSAKKNPVSTPLHLLQHLSHSLLEHLENACSEALVDAEKMLAKLEKQRGKGQDLLHKARTKLQDAAVAGKAKAQAKAKDAIEELESLLDGLQERQAETRTYIAQLKRDAQESLKLAQGVGKVKEAAAKPNCEVLWASTRELINIYQAEACGCQIITVPNSILAKRKNIGRDPYEVSLDTVRGFAKDIAALGFHILP